MIKEDADLYQKAKEAMRVLGENQEVARRFLDAVKNGDFAGARMSLNASMERYREQERAAPSTDSEWSVLLDKANPRRDLIAPEARSGWRPFYSTGRESFRSVLSTTAWQRPDWEVDDSPPQRAELMNKFT
jgi:hypothetical protein